MAPLTLILEIILFFHRLASFEIRYKKRKNCVRAVVYLVKKQESKGSNTFSWLVLFTLGVGSITSVRFAVNSSIIPF